jgi:hypothetical protein
VDLDEFPSASSYLTARTHGVAEWSGMADRLAALIRVPRHRLSPGAQVGLPLGETTVRDMPSILHPFPGQVWVADDVMRELSASGLSGVGFSPVTFRKGSPRQQYWELAIQGEAWRCGTSMESLTLCSICGRMAFGDGSMSVDSLRWDGSDFCNLDRNPNVVVVTQSVARFFELGKHPNVALVRI